VLPLYSSPFLHGAQPSYLIAIFGEGIVMAKAADVQQPPRHRLGGEDMSTPNTLESLTRLTTTQGSCGCGCGCDDESLGGFRSVAVMLPAAIREGGGERADACCVPDCGPETCPPGAEAVAAQWI